MLSESNYTSYDMHIEHNVNQLKYNTCIKCVEKMWIWRWICGKTKEDRIKNEHVREHLGIAPMGDKLREAR